ncbi:hypothetical protein BD310DRAFT_940181, partial [Dichomitus squalens]
RRKTVEIRSFHMKLGRTIVVLARSGRRTMSWRDVAPRREYDEHPTHAAYAVPTSALTRLSAELIKRTT